MLIKQTAQQTGLTERAIRYYEEADLVRPPVNASGFRDYDAAAIQRLKQIAALRRLGFTLGEIHALFHQPKQIRDLVGGVLQRQKGVAAAAENSTAVLTKLLDAGSHLQSPDAWLQQILQENSSDVTPGVSRRKKSFQPKRISMGGIIMSESKLSSVAFIAGLIALIIGFIEAAIRLYIGFTESVPFTLWHAVITFAVYAVPGICAIALGQVLENQTILHHQAQRAQLYLMEIAAEDDPGGGGPVRQETPKPWKCKQCDGLNETDSLYCRHCNGLRNLQAK